MIYSLSSDVQFQDGYMLHQFPSGYQHPEVPFFSIKWAIMGAPGPVWGRDVCWLEYGDIITDDNGKEVGFGVVVNWVLIARIPPCHPYYCSCIWLYQCIFDCLNPSFSLLTSYFALLSPSSLLPTFLKLYFSVESVQQPMALSIMNICLLNSLHHKNWHTRLWCVSSRRKALSI